VTDNPRLRYHGKIPSDILERIVFKHLGIKRKDVLLGPKLGEDAAVVKVGGKTLIVSTDPITGASERVGFLAVHVCANDVATRGVQPRWFTSCILLPEGVGEDIVQRICDQVDRAARELGVAVIAGHAEVTPGLNHPIVVGCMMGVAENGRYVTSSGAKPGDKLVLTKGVGIEGTAILASDREDVLSKRLGRDVARRARNFFEKISVVKDAMIAFKTGGVTAMHDPTEGGVAGGLHELADAANAGLKVYKEKMRVPIETRKICNFFGIDPLQLISSGSLLIAVRGEIGVTKLLKNLKASGIAASEIGILTNARKGRTLIEKNGREVELVRPVSDHLWKALAKSL
jgi:hydrogenase maturation factor